MSERLTCESEVMDGYSLKAMCESCGEDGCPDTCELQDNDCNNCPINEAFQKLAEYEKLEQDGLLVRLPYKVGDTVYYIRYSLALQRKTIAEGKCAVIKIFADGIGIDVIDGGGAIRKLDFNKTVFITKEAAEKALEELKK